MVAGCFSDYFLATLTAGELELTANGSVVHHDPNGHAGQADEHYEMEVVTTTNGRQAVELIRNSPDLSVMLMDIMMPEMDGDQTMREIRKDPQFRSLTILALRAKAMKGDREKCLEAGAYDYIAKPVNTGPLLSLPRVWLFR